MNPDGYFQKTAEFPRNSIASNGGCAPRNHQVPRLTVDRKYRNWAPAIIIKTFILGFSALCQADEATEYESYFGDEITTASCGLSCIEEWVMKPTFKCQMAIHDQHNLKCKVVVS